MALTSKAATDFQVKAKSDEIKKMREVCAVLADWRVTMQLKEQGVVPSPARLKEETNKDIDRLILLIQTNPDMFHDIMDNFINDKNYQGMSDPKAQAIFKQMGLVTLKGKIRAGAAEKIKSRVHRVVESSTLKELGVEVQRTQTAKPKSAFGRFLQAVQPTQTYDVNKPTTSSEDRVEALDKSRYKEDSQYRAQKLREEKIFSKLGVEATDEQRKMLRALKEIRTGFEKQEEYVNNPRGRMSESEQALDEAVGKIFGATKGVLGAIFGAGKPTPKVTEAKEEIEPSVEHKEYEHISPRGKAAPREVTEGVSYVMSHNEPTDAGAAEEIDQEQDELRESTIEFQDKNLATLKQIDEDLKILVDKEDSGGGIGDLLKLALGSVGKMLLGGLGSLLTGLTAFLGPLLLPLAGIAAVAGLATYLYKDSHKNDIDNLSPEDKAVWDEKHEAARDTKFQEDRSKFWESKEGQRQKAELEKRGFEIVNNVPVLKSAKKDAEIAAAETESLEPMVKNTAEEIGTKTEVAAASKNEKDNAQLADTLSNVVTSSSSKNTVISPAANTAKTKGRENPRNPDNSLSLYLNSRVIKFA